jgi:hypothetical protein
MSSHRPQYIDLPALDDELSHHAWDVYGTGDRLGTVNLLTPGRVAAAAGECVRTGERFVLSLPLNEPSPPMFGRRAIVHTVLDMGEQGFDDRLDCFYPQVSTQWDSLSHWGHSTGFYGGASRTDVRNGRLGIDAIGAVGIAGRGVLIDVAGYQLTQGQSIDPTSDFSVGLSLLKEVADWEAVEFREGDILCLRVGWTDWYLGLSSEQRVDVARISEDYAQFRVPGLSAEPDLVRFLWDTGFAAIAVDNPTVEAMPVVPYTGVPTKDDTFHARVIGLLGMTIGEFFKFDELAQACANDDRYEFLFVSAPLIIPGGVGSPPNALAIR